MQPIFQGWSGLGWARSDRFPRLVSAGPTLNYHLRGGL